jgi:hypothetical protein
MRFEARRRLLTAALAIGMIAAVSAAGVAGGALKTNSAVVEIPVDGQGSVTAKCAKPTKVVSGGFDAPAFEAAEGPLTFALVSERTGRRTWTTSALNYDEPGELVGYVYCSKTLPTLKVRSASKTLGDDDDTSVSARCKKGGEAVSGGFVTGDFENEELQPYESRRTGKRRWTVSATNFGPGANELTAIAYCAQHKLGLKAKSAEDTTTEQGSLVFAEARCRKGTKAVSGGFSGVMELNDRQTVPFQSTRTGRSRWSSAALAGFVGGTGPTITWTTYVYCLDKKEL